MSLLAISHTYGQGTVRLQIVKKVTNLQQTLIRISCYYNPVFLRLDFIAPLKPTGGRASSRRMAATQSPLDPKFDGDNEKVKKLSGRYRVTHACRKRRLKWVHNAHVYSWVTLSQIRRRGPPGWGWAWGWHPHPVKILLSGNPRKTMAHKGLSYQWWRRYIMWYTHLQIV
jgi:hypothetical protein